MKIKVQRFSENNESTVGLLFIDDVFYCFTLEDEGRAVKVFNETRIPSGTYKIGYRKVGGHHERYLKRFGNNVHYGMLEIKDVPNFKYILIHIGNDDDDTSGCVIVGDICHNNIDADGYIGKSAVAYVRIYKLISKALEQGEEVSIQIIDNAK